MGRIREIKKRMVAVKNIQRITKTMQMIATAKFTSALARAKASQPYTEKIRELAASVAEAAGDVDHPLIEGPAETQHRELLLTIVSDRGMCGAFNGNVLRMAQRHIRDLKSKRAEIDAEISGKKAVGYFKYAKIPVAQRHTVFGDHPEVVDVHRLADRYIADFIEGKYDAIRVAYTKYYSNSRQVPEVMQLLPLTSPADSGQAKESDEAHAIYEFSPGSEALLDELLPATVRTSLFQAFNDAIVSEQVMRMIAMKAATDNAGELGRTLSRQFNRARQAQITTELMEVISGAAALD